MFRRENGYARPDQLIVPASERGEQAAQFAKDSAVLDQIRASVASGCSGKF
jgi:hypothetical protein